MKLGDIKNFLFGTLRGRLILGVALVHAVMMSIFIIDLTVRQRAMLLERQRDDALVLCQSLSNAAAAWLAADDISGLQEMVENQSSYSDLVFAILADESGHILAHTDTSKNGQFLLDLPAELRRTVISKTPDLVDVVTPSMLGNSHVGWARVGVSQKAASKKLAQITLDGFFYAFAAILFGSLIAWLMGNRITMRLYAVQTTINAVKRGDRLARSDLSGSDEATVMAQEFNAMLDALSERDLKLQNSEENFRRLIDDSPVAIAVTVGDNVESLNKKFTEILGYKKEDIPDMSLWWPLAYPNEGYRAKVMAKWSAKVYEALKNKTAMQPMEASVRCKDGSTRQIEFHMSAIGEKSLTTFIDVTEREKTSDELKKSVEIVEKIFLMTTTSIAYMDRDFNFIKVNNQYAAADGKSPEDFIGKNHFDLYPDEENKKIFKNVIETGQQYMAYAKPFEYKEHPERGVSYWDWSLVPVKNTDSVVETIILSLVNVTDKIKAQEELKKLNEELELMVRMRTEELEARSSELNDNQLALMNIVEDLNLKAEELETLNKSLQDEIKHRIASEEEASFLNADLLKQKQTLEAVNRELEAFSYSVSHDLRAPLRAIDGFSQAVLEDYGDKLGEEGWDYLKRIRAASQRMGQLIDDILGLSRLSRSEMKIEDVDLSSIARMVIHDLKTAHPESKAEVVIQDGVTAKCDSRLLHIALENLLGNAWKFSSKNESPRIEFGSSIKEEQTVYFVKDNGIGFDMTYSYKLFNPFQRLHSIDEFPGTGIGLATVRRIIMRHKGSIWAESEPGHGTIFYFTV